MPAGPGPMGYVYFAGVKAIGYTAVSAVLKSGYGLRDAQKPKLWAVGLTRTGIGIAVGGLYGIVWLFVRNKLSTADFDSLDSLRYFGTLIPIRFAEWSLLIWIFFDRGLRDRERQWKYAGIGILCSFLLDAIGVGAAMVLPGGFWVC
jgi:hypothetical protein